MEYVLRAGGLSAVVDSLGAELVSLRGGDGTEYIWQGQPGIWSGHNPNLFPVVGAVHSAGILYDGRAFPTPRHGFARRSGFSPVEKSDDCVCLELRDSPYTRALYPYPFRLRISHRLDGKGFSTRYDVMNPGGGDIYFCVGGHTAFNCPLFGDGGFSQWRLSFDRDEDVPAIVPLEGGFISFENRLPVIQGDRHIVLDHALHDRVDTLIFRGLNSRGVALTGPSGRGLHVDFGDFPMIAFWTQPGKKSPFICIEPWAGCGDGPGAAGEFSAKPHAIRLGPGESRSLGYRVSLI